MDFESEVKKEIGNLEGQMKIGWTTMRRIAEKVRDKRFSNCSKLKNLRFTKETFEISRYLGRFFN